MMLILSSTELFSYGRYLTRRFKLMLKISLDYFRD